MRSQLHSGPYRMHLGMKKKKKKGKKKNSKNMGDKEDVIPDLALVCRAGSYSDFISSRTANASSNLSNFASDVAFIARARQ